MTSFEHFDGVYCIHLPNEDRREKIEAELDRVGIHDVTFIHAKPPQNGFTMSNMRRNPGAEFGANLSHLKAIIRAMHDGCRRPLFIEDDIVFLPGAAERLQAAWDELPADWDVLYLGGHPRGKTPQASRYSEHLARVGTFSFAEAYSINGIFNLRGLFDAWCDRIGYEQAMWDFILGEYCASHHGYCVYPVITEQPPGWSQIGNKQDDKRHCIRSGWANHLC